MSNFASSKRIGLSIAGMLLVLSSNAFADPHSKTRPIPLWAGNFQFGLTSNTGNSQNASFNTGLDLKYQPGNWRHSLKLQAQYSSDRGNTTGERFTENWESRYFLDKRRLNFLFGRVAGVQDKFATYNPIYSGVLGYGHRLFETPSMHLDVLLGPGYRYSVVQGASKHLDETIFYTELHYHWDITKKTSFIQDIKSELGHRNNFVETNTALKTNLIGKLALQLSFNLRYNSYIPPETKRTHHYDTTTMASVLYDF